MRLYVHSRQLVIELVHCFILLTKHLLPWRKQQSKPYHGLHRKQHPACCCFVFSLQAAGRPVHRTAFTRGAADGSLLFNPFDFTLKNVANTGVLNWGGRLLALYEVRVIYCSRMVLGCCCCC
jgi:hypothetical protein